MRSAKSARVRELGRIHMLSKELKLDDESYRNVLHVVARVDSSKDLDTSGRQLVIKHLESRLPRHQRYRGRPKNADLSKRLEMTKIEALLTDAGLGWNYAKAMAKRMYRRDALEFCDNDQLAGIVTALEKNAIKRLVSELETELKRHGYGWIHARFFACHGFRFSQTRSLECYAEPMSQVLRWLRGELVAPACPWPPVDPEIGEEHGPG